MKIRSFIFGLVTLLLSLSVLSSCKTQSDHSGMIAIPPAGNSWVINNITENEKVINERGIINWTDTTTLIRTFFRVEQAGSLNIAIRASSGSGKSKILARFGNLRKKVLIKNYEFDTIDIGSFKIEKPGYYWLDMKGLVKSDTTFPDITDIFISGQASEGELYYVKDDFYWGRRGPSVHLRYDIPSDAGEVEWFYNEITVPEGNDVLGSYFMANGFADGYFGIQVNSPTERRILFSVWSPYKTDNPKEIPDEYKVKLLKKGTDVNAQDFGNEGSGGQSFRRYYWKTGLTYGFLLKGAPSVNGSTDYTAYFISPETGRWELIASFRRPKTTSYLKNLYSFLENFMTETGSQTRQAFYSNQWVCNKNGNWIELTGVKFTADATARKDSRLDYAGGVENGMFYLKNCGFFNDRTAINSKFTRAATGKKPELDLKNLE